jgi:hypothetical protein
MAEYLPTTHKAEFEPQHHKENKQKTKTYSDNVLSIKTVMKY